MTIKELWNKIRRRKPEPPIQPITYGIHVFMRESGERLRHLENMVRDIDRRIAAMDDGQGQAVAAAKMEFETLVESWKTGLQTQIHRHDEAIGEVVEAIHQIENRPKSP